MKEERILQERIRLLEQEVQTLATEIQKLNATLSLYQELSTEIKGLKLFLGRVYPDFKNQFPEIMRKIQPK
jgi:prefoldin subunit 5